MCQRLLLSGCDPTLVDDSGDTPLHIACRHGNLLCFSVLTQNCQPAHLHTVMAACNYHGKIVIEQCFFPELTFPPLNILTFTFITFLINASVMLGNKMLGRLNYYVSTLLEYYVLEQWW